MTAEPARPPDLYAVGRRAGVSHQTVSRVLNDHPNVRPETRLRVLAAIHDLGYRRNASARALATRRSAVVGVLAAGTECSGPDRTLTAIERASAQDPSGTLIVSRPRTGAEQSFQTALDALVEQAVDGLVVVAPKTEDRQSLARLSTATPVVEVGDGPEVTGAARVLTGQAAGAAAATARLFERGCGRVAHLAGPLNWCDAAERRIGWAAASSGRRREPVLTGDWSAESGYWALATLDRSGDLPDGLFVANDDMALGVLRACRERGIRVPLDLAVVGFDDTPGAAFFDPPLTTVRQDFDGIGTAAVALLRTWIAGGPGEPPPVAHVQPRIVLRQSC